MSFVLFLRGFILVLAVFAVTTYAITGSLWTTLIQTVVCAVLIQVGYFAAVLFMVWRSPAKADAPQAEAGSTLSKEEQPASKIASRLPGAPSSDHP